MLPDVVDTTMRLLCKSLQFRLSDTVESVYVYGSTALGAYIEGSSDIDFIAIVNRTPTPTDIRNITEAHEDVEKSIPGLDIMGAYIRREDLGKSAQDIVSFLTYKEKQIYTNGFGADINPVTWWVLRNHGICVYGQDLPFNYVISTDELIQYVIDNMNSYWAGWIDRLEQHLNAPDLSEQSVPREQLDFAVEWCTLGMLRQYYSIREQDVTSKTGAGEYGLQLLPERCHGLIREAIAIKRRDHSREYTSQVSRLEDLVKLLRLIHSESNRIVQRES